MIGNNKNPKKIIIKNDNTLEQEKIKSETELKLRAFDVADDDLLNVMNKSARYIIGGSGRQEFIFNGNKYNIMWNGFWEKGTFYNYNIIGNNTEIKGIRYLD